MKPFSPGETAVLQFTHRTRIDYDKPVVQGHSEIRKTPIKTGLQKPIETSLKVSPEVKVKGFFDHFKNQIFYFDILEPHRHIDIVSSGLVETTNGVCCGREGSKDERYIPVLVSEYTGWSPAVPKLMEYETIPNKVDTKMNQTEFEGALKELAGHFFYSFRYDPDVTHVFSNAKELFTHGGGVCQDMAHAMIGVLRLAGIPARYVSGYIYDPKKGEQGAHLRGASATHAWVQAWHKEAGWIGADPTNNKLVDWQYIRTAIGRDYFDVPPLRGTFVGSANQRVTVEG